MRMAELDAYRRQNRHETTDLDTLLALQEADEAFEEEDVRRKQWKEEADDC